MGKKRGAVVVAVVVAVGASAVAWSVALRGDRPIRPQSIVLLGDSITAQGDWEALLPGRPIVERGHPGFTSAQLIAVAASVADQQPRAVIVLAGTNDLRDGQPADWTIRNLTAIVDEFERRSPATAVVLSTVLPRDDRPDEVIELNARITELAVGLGVGLVDPHRALADADGGLRPADTTDGLHLTSAGYERLAAALLPVVAELQQET